MHSHPMSRQERVPLRFLAAQAGISLRTAYKWLARFRAGGPGELADRRSVRHGQQRTLDQRRLQQAIDLRHQRSTLRRIARVLQVPLSTVGRAMNALGLGRLRNLEPKQPVQRYQWQKPGDMIHVDTKQLACFQRVGHRITGDRKQGCSRGAGFEKVHVAVEDATRLAYVEVLPDEQQSTTIGFPPTSGLQRRSSRCHLWNIAQPRRNSAPLRA